MCPPWTSHRFRPRRCAVMWTAASLSARPALMRYKVRRRPGFRGSRAVIRASWDCPCSRRRNCCAAGAWRSEYCRMAAGHAKAIEASARKRPMEDILINWSPQETRVAVVENGAVQELHIERTLERGLVGNVYSGKVARVLPGMQSAFIDIGLERAAFLHVADLHVNGATPRSHHVDAGAAVPIERPMYSALI
eukprot:Opistho-2@62320